MSTDITTHEHPSRKDRANFLIFASLDGDGLRGKWEQLWARRVAEAEFEVCCIPYFAYGVALGDIVRTAPALGKTYVVAGVAVNAGRRVLRLWLKGAAPNGRARLAEAIATDSLLAEWRTENLVAIDLPVGDLPTAIGAVVANASALGMQVEWGK